jgi:hypothetical protein
MKIFGISVAIFLALGIIEASAQESGDIRKKAMESFSEARDQRSKLLIEIPRLKESIEDLQRQRSRVLSIQNEKRSVEEGIARAQADIKRAEQNLQNAPAEQRAVLKSRIQEMEDYIRTSKSRLPFLEANLKGVGEDVKRLDDELKQKQTELSQRQGDLEAAERRINELLNFELPRQKFKLIMSGVFATLVAGVIVGFFWIAHRDERVRVAIFSGAAGIQFVTLFSLVIAIILFGIIEILEGKELAALLGGLSGYILGRATSDRAAIPAQARGTQEVNPVPQDA